MRVFDDAKVGLVQEPFVGGADLIIDRAVEGIMNAEAGFLMLFSCRHRGTAARGPMTNICQHSAKSGQIDHETGTVKAAAR
jgi:hypothetical protein